MEILRATAEDLAAILKLQYLAFQSEAIQVGSSDIQPLTQSLDKLAKEFDRGMIYKASIGTEELSVRFADTLPSDLSEHNIRLYEKNGYSPFRTKPTTGGFNLVYLQKQ